ncbi:hypothetical protein SMC26_08450 [Actinomadura fulvescens]
MTTADKQAIGARLRAEREAPPRRSREKWAILLRHAAGPDAARLPSVESLADMIKQWERGTHVPGPIYRPLYVRVTGKSEAELFGPGEASPLVGNVTSTALANASADAGDEALTGSLEGSGPTKRRDALKLGVAAIAPEVVRRVLPEAAAEAMEFTRRAGVTALGPGVFSHLEAVVTELDGLYSRDAPTDLFSMARTYRHRVAELIDGPHTLKQGRDLYVYAAWLSEALAWLAHDLGDPLAAEAWAIDAFEHADQAGHDELCAWATDAMASIAIYADRPAVALHAAQRGILKAPQRHPLAIRLRAQAARAHARLRQREGCEAMLGDAEDLYDRLPARAPLRFTVDTGGLASLAMTSYPASAYIWLGDADRGDFAKAKKHAQAALDAQRALPEAQRSPSREAIARVDLALAAVELGEPDTAAGLGMEALATPRLVDSVRSRAGDLYQVLGVRHAKLPAVRDFQETYRHAVQAR